jgi:pimeloyl-ACP methyl ester carboxylesterase
MTHAPETRYARTGDGTFLAYQIIAGSPHRLVFMPHWATHIEAIWEDPAFARFMKRLGSFSQVLFFDKRGVGLSDPVSLQELPTLESWMDDLSTVMDQVGWQDASILTADAAGPMAMLFAATHPERTSALILVNTAARIRRDSDYPAGLPEHMVTAFLRELESKWGAAVTLDSMNPSVAAGCWASTLAGPLPAPDGEPRRYGRDGAHAHGRGRASGAAEHRRPDIGSPPLP